MFGNNIILYATIGSGFMWKPSIDVAWDIPTHFIHRSGDYTGDGIPLNRSWDIDFTWLWLHISLSLNIDLDYPSGEDIDT